MGLLTPGDPSTIAGDPEIKTEQRSKNGVTLAYGLQWSAYFQEWTFLWPYGGEQDNVSLLGTCVEGVRVDFSSPGYQGSTLLAIANSVGPNAPKTNVARSGLEATPELQSLLRTIYELYCDHVKTEIDTLQKERRFSLTWALEEATWLLDPLLHRLDYPGRDAPVDVNALVEACSEVPSITLEANGSRSAVSAKQLSNHPFFWTVDSAFFASAEALVKEIPAPIAISSLAEIVGPDLFRLPLDPYISAQQRYLGVYDLRFRNREVDRIVVHRDQRRVDMRWRKVDDAPIWRSAIPDNKDARAIVQRVFQEMPPRGGVPKEPWNLPSSAGSGARGSRRGNSNH